VHRIVLWRICRGDGIERSICLCYVEAESRFAEMPRAFLRGFVKCKSAEFCLRVGENVFDRRELQQVPWIARAKANALAAINNCASKTERDGGDPVGISHGLNWIEIVRSYDSREVWIETLAMLLPDDLLQDYGHLLFFQPIRRRAYVGLRVLA